MADETKTCPHCGKKLRSDNTKGVCANCQSRGRTLEGAPTDGPAVEPAERKPRKSAESALKRFRAVAAGLGEDPDELLETFAEEWLEALRENLRKVG